MSFIIDGTSGLTFNNATTQNSGGKVIQVVSTTTSTSTTTVAGPVDTTLTATITPLFSTSKIAVFIAQQFYLYNGGADSGVVFALLRNGSLVLTGQGQSAYVAGISPNQPEIIINFPINYVDSPATTSAVTYKTQMTANSGATVTTQWNTNTSTIILMEIAA
jgi:hypothetical protein